MCLTSHTVILFPTCPEELSAPQSCLPATHQPLSSPARCPWACKHMGYLLVPPPWCCRCCTSGSCSLPPASPSARWPAASPSQPHDSGWWLSRLGHPHQGTGGLLQRMDVRVTRALTSSFLGGLAQLRGPALCPAWIPSPHQGPEDPATPNLTGSPLRAGAGPA